MAEKEVVITGLGVVTPMDHGRGVDVFWKGLRDARNAIRPIQSFDVRGYNCQVGGEISGFEKFLKDSSLSNHSRCTRMFALASQQAFEDSGLKIDSEPVGVSFGSILGGIDSGQRYMDRAFFHDGLKDASLLEDYSLHSIPACIARRRNLKGPNFCICTACSSSADALGLALNEIRSGRVHVMLAGGADMLSEFMFRGFSALEALTKDSLVRPFDKQRTGLAVSEGAGALIMEEMNHAQSRNAKIYCKVMGFGSIIDAYHLVKPHEEGLGLARAINTALTEAGIEAGDVDYINAHGTGTVYNDLAETKAVKLSFGKEAEYVKISSIKSMIGHTMGASSVIEAICCVKVMQDNIIPPTINYEVPDPDCDLDYVPNVAFKAEVNISMSLSAGFGGQNTALILGKMKI